MTAETPHYNEPIAQWSAQEIKARGFDTPSFMKRMKNRLKKVRGEDETDANFLTRHNYQKNVHSIA